MNHMLRIPDQQLARRIDVEVPHFQRELADQRRAVVGQKVKQA
jgi:hypothetical protein